LSENQARTFPTIAAGGNDEKEEQNSPTAYGGIRPTRCNCPGQQDRKLFCHARAIRTGDNYVRLSPKVKALIATGAIAVVPLVMVAPAASASTVATVGHVSAAHQRSTQVSPDDYEWKSVGSFLSLATCEETADQFREFNPNVLGAVCVAEPSGVFGTVYNLYIYVNVDD